MNKPLLIVYGSRFGHSADIATHLARGYRQAGVECVIVDVAHALNSISGTRFATFRGVIIIASVQYGHIDKRAEKWVKKNLAALQNLPTMLVTVSLSARKFADIVPDPAEHSYTKKFLDRTGWSPTKVELAAGRLEYPRYNLFDRKMIQLIMHISGGETDGTSTIEYTDWERLSAAGAEFYSALED